MARKKIPDEFLSEEQRKRRERNERYYRLKKENDDASQMLIPRLRVVSKTGSMLSGKRVPKAKKPKDHGRTKEKTGSGIEDVKTSKIADPKFRVVSKTESSLKTKRVSKVKKPKKLTRTKHLRSFQPEVVTNNESHESLKRTEDMGSSQSIGVLNKFTGVLNTSQRENETLLEANQYWAEWLSLKIILSAPAVFFAVLIIVAVSSLLTYFQAEVYLKEGFDLISWPLAVICELSLVSLAAFFAAGYHKKTALILFVGMFLYSLGTMSYDLKMSKVKEIVAVETGGEKSILQTTSLKQAQEALAVAIKKQESGNISRHAQTVAELTKLMSKDGGLSSTAALITYKYDGLIFLRGLLMLINAFLIHFVMTRVLGRRLPARVNGG